MMVVAAHFVIGGNVPLGLMTTQRNGGHGHEKDL
jgi:hypothetical protein